MILEIEFPIFVNIVLMAVQEFMCNPLHHFPLGRYH